MYYYHYYYYYHASYAKQFYALCALYSLFFHLSNRFCVREVHLNKKIRTLICIGPCYTQAPGYFPSKILICIINIV